MRSVIKGIGEGKYKVVYESETDSDPEDVFSDAYNGIKKKEEPQKDSDREYDIHRVEGDTVYLRPKVQRMSEEESRDFYERLARFHERCQRLDEEEAQRQRENGFPDDKARIPGAPIRLFRTDWTPEIEQMVQNRAKLQHNQIQKNQVQFAKDLKIDDEDEHKEQDESSHVSRGNHATAMRRGAMMVGAASKLSKNVNAKRAPRVDGRAGVG